MVLENSFWSKVLNNVSTCVITSMLRRNTWQMFARRSNGFKECVCVLCKSSEPMRRGIFTWELLSNICDTNSIFERAKYSVYISYLCVHLYSNHSVGGRGNLWRFSLFLSNFCYSSVTALLLKLWKNSRFFYVFGKSSLYLQKQAWLNFNWFGTWVLTSRLPVQVAFIYRYI